MKNSIRNISTKHLLLLIAKVNFNGYPYLDLKFDTVEKTISIAPLTQEERDERLMKNKGEKGTNVEDIINEV